MGRFFYFQYWDFFGQVKEGLINECDIKLKLFLFVVKTCSFMCKVVCENECGS